MLRGSIHRSRPRGGERMLGPADTSHGLLKACALSRMHRGLGGHDRPRRVAGCRPTRRLGQRCARSGPSQRRRWRRTLADRRYSPPFLGRGWVQRIAGAFPVQSHFPAAPLQYPCSNCAGRLRRFQYNIKGLRIQCRCSTSPFRPECRTAPVLCQYIAAVVGLYKYSTICCPSTVPVQHAVPAQYQCTASSIFGQYKRQ